MTDLEFDLYMKLEKLYDNKEISHDVFVFIAEMIRTKEKVVVTTVAPQWFLNELNNDERFK